MRCRPALAIGQLAFVNDESGFVFAFQHLRNDLIEGHDFGLDSRREELQSEIGSSQSSRDRNLCA